MKRGTLFLYIGRLVSAGTTLVLLAVVGRFAGSRGLGVVGVGMSIGALAAAVTEQGASLLVVRALAQHPDRAGHIIGALTLTRAVMAPIGLIAVYALVVAAFPQDAAPIWLAAAWLVVQQASELNRAVLVWGARPDLSGLHTCLENVVWLAAMMTMVALQASLELVFAAGLAVLLVSLVLGFGLVWLALGLRPAWPSQANLNQLIRDSPPFMGFVVLGQLYSRVDTLLIGVLLAGGLEAAGAYFAAMRLIVGLEYLPEALSRALYPNLAQAYVSGSGLLTAIIERPIRLLLWLSIPAPFVAFLGADWGFPLLFGHEVFGFGWILVTVSLFLPLRFVGYLLGIVLTTGGAQAKRVLAVGAASVIVVGLDVVLLPRIGLAAAVIALMTASLTTFTIYFFQVRRSFGPPVFLESATTPLAWCLAAFALGLAVRSLAAADVGPPAALVAFGGIYALGLVRSRRGFANEGGGSEGPDRDATIRERLSAEAPR